VADGSGASETPEHTYVVRAGIALFTQPAHVPENVDVPTKEQFYDRLLAALDADKRVNSPADVPSADNVIKELTMAGPDSRDVGGHVASPHSHVHVARFERPIVFKIHVARRFQPTDQGDKAIPAEDYWVAWDGVQILVMWERPAKGFSNTYGGIAAIQILEEAVKSLGLELFIEPCGPNCDFPFSHRDLLVMEAEEVPDREFHLVDETTVSVFVPAAKDPLVILRGLSARLSFSGRLFARMRRYGVAVTHTEGEARSELADLLKLHYEGAEARSKGFWKSIPDWFRAPARSTKASRLTGALWLRLATIETNRRGWSIARQQYDAAAPRDGRGLIFGYEYPQEIERVTGVDVEDLRSAVSGMTARADSRSVAAATVSGAIGGGLVGAIVTLVAALVRAPS